MKTNLKKIAFTMAEIMLVMSIIGITAVLTIPNLVDNYNEEQTIVKLRKTKNDLSRAYISAINKYGEFYLWGTSGTTQAKRITEFLKGNYGGTASLPSGVSYDANYTIYELEDGTTLAILPPGNTGNGFEIITYALGAKGGNQIGKNVFSFYIDTEENIVQVSGFGQDKDTDTGAFTGGIASPFTVSNWALHIGNLDYLKCNDLNWNTKTTCD